MEAESDGPEPAPVWKFEIKSTNPEDLEQAARFFPTGAVRIEAGEGSWLMCVDGLESDTPYTEAFEAADTELARLRGFLALLHADQFDIVRSGPYITPDGDRVDPIFPGSVAAPRLTGGPAPAVPRLPGVAALDLARSGDDDDVADILRLLGEHPHDWFTLYKVHEIMQSAGWTMVGKQWDDFGFSANHQAASGDVARHARMKGDPGNRKSMSLENARNLVMSEAHSFVFDRAGAGPVDHR